MSLSLVAKNTDPGYDQVNDRGIMHISQDGGHKPRPAFPFKENYVNVPGGKLYALTMGKGNPLIVVHGGPGLTKDYLLPQMAQLAKNNEVVFYDQRGGGKSSGTIMTGNITVESFVEDLEALRLALGYGKVSILGHSWGALLAMHYAIEHPGNLDNLVLMNPMPGSSAEYASYTNEWLPRGDPARVELERIEKSEEFAKGDPATFAYYYRIIFSRFCHNPSKADELNLNMTQKAALNGVLVRQLIGKDLYSKPYDLHGPLKKLKVPALVIQGDSDLIPVSVGENLHKSIPGSNFVLIEKSGHFPYIENPDALFSSLNEFLKDKK